ncbi:kynureninase [Actinoalloteichus spitiensis]|uniref:kynureninase n=1 Tax=Actinoalloteichus spitiensis TaxID=252394 RepID=UPI0003716893|nr:kynureninase [Actinoalloteichus spitiensis]
MADDRDAAVEVLAARAAEADAADPLAHLRDQFDLDEEVVYLDGNSLGALPTSVPGRLREVVEQEWGRGLIRSWRGAGWWDAPERVGDRIAPLVGAAPGQIVVGDSTSVNVFRLTVAGLRAAAERDPRRTELLVDETTFPTDGYLARSAAQLTGAPLVPCHPSDLSRRLGDRTGLVLLNHVDYRTGELWDLPTLTAAARDAGALTLWDLSHSAGALPVGLDQAGVDLAVGCGYKYLNGGPGAPAFCYVRADLQERLDQPLTGWCSHADPFGMEPDYRAASGATRFRTGTPEILSLLSLDAALDVWAGVDLTEVRRKSLALTGFFVSCLDVLAPAGSFRLLTPRADERRGSQVALECDDARAVMAALEAQGVIGDHRPPNVCRFGFAPLYTRFVDALTAADALSTRLRARDGVGPA